MAKMSIIFDGFEELARRVDKSNNGLQKAVDEALTETQKLIQSNVSSAAAPYARKGRKGYATGKMYGAIIKNASVEWQGSRASVEVGFKLKGSATGGGWHSIFVMHGTPRIKKDSKLYNSIKGKRTENQIKKLQEEIMEKYITIDKKG